MDISCDFSFAHIFLQFASSWTFVVGFHWTIGRLKVFGNCGTK